MCVCVCYTTQADPLWRPSAGAVVGGGRSKVRLGFIMTCHLSASTDASQSEALRDTKRSNERLLSFQHNVRQDAASDGKHESKHLLTDRMDY